MSQKVVTNQGIHQTNKEKTRGLRDRNLKVENDGDKPNLWKSLNIHENEMNECSTVLTKIIAFEIVLIAVMHFFFPV